MEAYVMDAFSARLFGGNQAGVALPEQPLEDAVMQQVAACLLYTSPSPRD